MQRAPENVELRIPRGSLMPGAVQPDAPLAPSVGPEAGALTGPEHVIDPPPMTAAGFACAFDR